MASCLLEMVKNKKEASINAVCVGKNFMGKLEVNLVNHNFYTNARYF